MQPTGRDRQIHKPQGQPIHVYLSSSQSGAKPWRRIGALGISAGSTAVLRCAIDTQKLAAGIAVATYLGHFASMPNGPAKVFVDHLDTLLAGGIVEDKVVRATPLTR